MIWRTDFENAPKDGTRILLWCDFEGRQEAAIAWWRSPALPSWGGQYGPFTWETPDGGGCIAERIPTHWQPIEPPETGQ